MSIQENILKSSAVSEQLFNAIKSQPKSRVTEVKMMSHDGDFVDMVAVYGRNVFSRIVRYDHKERSWHIWDRDKLIEVPFDDLAKNIFNGTWRF